MLLLLLRTSLAKKPPQTAGFTYSCPGRGHLEPQRGRRSKKCFPSAKWIRNALSDASPLKGRSTLCYPLRVVLEWLLGSLALLSILYHILRERALNDLAYYGCFVTVLCGMAYLVGRALRELLKFKRSEVTWVLLLLFGFLVLCVDVAWRKSPTWDEPTYVSAGYYHWTRGKLKTYSGAHPPLSMLVGGLPFLLLDARSMDMEMITSVGRMPLCLLASLIGLYVYLWARELWGKRGALLSLFLYCASPTIIAHASLFTTDLLLSAMLFVCAYYLRRVCLSNEWELREAISVGIALGLALSTKLTGTILMGIIPLTLLVARHRSGLLSSTFASLFLSVVVGGMVLWVCVGLGGIETVRIAGLPIPLPEHYASILRWQTGRAGLGGDYRYILSVLLKTPLPALLLLGLCPFYITKSDGREILLLLLPVALYYASVLTLVRGYLGVRIVLAVYLFGAVLVGAVVRLCQKLLWCIFLLTMITWSVVELVLIHPHELSYFNQIVGGPANAYRVLLDSDLDWGQDLRGLARFVKRYRIKHLWLEYHGSALRVYMKSYRELPARQLPPHRVGGWIAISVTSLMDDRLPYAWLRKEKPLAVIGYSIFLYHLPEPKS